MLHPDSFKICAGKRSNLEFRSIEDVTNGMSYTIEFTRANSIEMNGIALSAEVHFSLSTDLKHLGSAGD